MSDTLLQHSDSIGFSLGRDTQPSQLYASAKVPLHSKGSVIISGASSGIGRATCGYLAERHPAVTFYCGVRNTKTTSSYPFTLPNVKHVILDATEPKQVQDAIHEAVRSSNSGPLIGVVSNAGTLQLKTLEFESMQDIQQHFDVNVFGSLRLTKAALPELRKNQGRIVWVSSISAMLPPFPRMGTYISTKTAMETLMDTMRKELRPHGVAASLIEPGMIKSGMTEQTLLKDRKRVATNTTNTYDVIETAQDEEMKTYPDLYSPERLGSYASIFAYGGHMEETCKAIEHALFAQCPKTRYTTSRLLQSPPVCLPRFPDCYDLTTT